MIANKATMQILSFDVEQLNRTIKSLQQKQKEQNNILKFEKWDELYI